VSEHEGARGKGIPEPGASTQPAVALDTSISPMSPSRLKTCLLLFPHPGRNGSPSGQRFDCRAEFLCHGRDRPQHEHLRVRFILQTCYKSRDWTILQAARAIALLLPATLQKSNLTKSRRSRGYRIVIRARVPTILCKLAPRREQSNAEGSRRARDAIPVCRV